MNPLPSLQKKDRFWHRLPPSLSHPRTTTMTMSVFLRRRRRGRRRLQDHGLCHLWGLSQPFCCTLPAAGWRCLVGRPGEGPKVGVLGSFGGSGVKVCRCLRVLRVCKLTIQAPLCGCGTHVPSSDLLQPLIILIVLKQCTTKRYGGKVWRSEWQSISQTRTFRRVLWGVSHIVLTRFPRAQ